MDPIELPAPDPEALKSMAAVAAAGIALGVTPPAGAVSPVPSPSTPTTGPIPAPGPVPCPAAPAPDPEPETPEERDARLERMRDKMAEYFSPEEVAKRQAAGGSKGDKRDTAETVRARATAAGKTAFDELGVEYQAEKLEEFDIVGLKDPRKKKKQPSITALVHDSWSMRKGREWRRDVEFARETAVTDADKKAADAAKKSDYFTDFTAADVRAAFYEQNFEFSPDGCTDPLWEEYFRSAVETDEFREARRHTMWEEEFSRMAGGVLAKKYVAFIDRKNEERKQKGMAPLAKPGEKGAGEGDGMGGEAPEMSEEDMLDAMAAGATAAAEAEKETQDADKVRHGMGGLGGGAGGRTRGALIRELVKRVKKNRALKNIIDLLGAFRNAERSARQAKIVHGQDEVVGIEVAGRLKDMLPSELAQLAVPELEILKLKQLCDHQVLCRDLVRPEPKTRGPLLVIIDESGSMSGIKVESAKAFALAIALSCLEQKRWCKLISYSGTSVFQTTASLGDTAANRQAIKDKKKYPDSPNRHLRFYPDTESPTEIADWLEHFLSGGSGMDVPILEVPRWWEDLDAPKGITDVVMITDAEMYEIPKLIKQTFIDWKTEAHARVTCMVLENNGGQLKDVADTMYENIPAFKADQEHVQEVFAALSSPAP